MTTNEYAARAIRLRLDLVPPYDERRRDEREDSLRHARAALRRLDGRPPRPADRFAYLKRLYD